MNSPRTIIWVGAVALAGAAAILLHMSVERSARALNAQPSVTTHELQTALYRVSLSPEVLTAAGLSSVDTALVVQNALADLAGDSGLEPLDEAFGQATTDSQRLVRLVRSGQASEQEIADLSIARQQLSIATFNRDNALDDLFDSATADLSDQQRQSLSTIRGNQHWKLSTEFLVIDRSEEQWVQLRNALANERIAAEYGEAPDPDAQTLLQAERGVPAVAIALANLDANLPMVQAAWEQATQP